MLFWDELVELCEWAFSDQGTYSIQELSHEDAWVLQIDDEQGLTCWRATLSFDGRWTLSPVY
jgi:hypothetical protein